MAEKFTVEKPATAHAPAKRLEASSAPAAEKVVAGHGVVQEGTLLHWAKAKGHVPADRGDLSMAPGAIHKGPDVSVVLMHLRAPAIAAGEPIAHALNSPMTEAEYDEAVAAAYGVTLGENLADAALAVGEEAQKRLAAKAAREGAKAAAAAARAEERAKKGKA